MLLPICVVSRKTHSCSSFARSHEPACCAAAHATKPAPQSQRHAPTAGDQLSNAMGNGNSDSLFIDPSWRDPDLGGGLQQHSQLAPPSASSYGSMRSQPTPSVSSAQDPFSQLSLSWGPSGGGSDQFASSVQPVSNASRVGTAAGGSGSGMRQWQSSVTNKGLVSLNPQNGLAGLASVSGMQPVTRSSSGQVPSSQQQQSLI